MSVPVLNAVKFGDIQNYFNCNSDFHFTGNSQNHDIMLGIW
jgi:hypothetical protein